MISSLKKKFTNSMTPARVVLFAAFAAVVLPGIGLAQNDPDLGAVTTFIDAVGGILELLLPIAVTLALLAFFWGLAKFIFAAGDESAKAAGKNIMIWGIIALFIIVSIWGIVGLLGTIFGVDQGQSAPVPGVEENAGGTGFGANAGGQNNANNPGGGFNPPPPGSPGTP